MNRSQPILCINNGIVYKSLLDAATKLNVTKGAISNHLAGKRSSVGGLVFVKVTGTESVSELENITVNAMKEFFKIEVGIKINLSESSESDG